ncbi:MAG: glyoxalase/bleomycin resistance/dioxygenase family protein [Phycisphaerales bacterium]|nr:VOC family protein [Phycisphaerae bacterium]NNF43030.1 glyoxalase/bleomycin resistance/dioxygenase family protein [Phycisphaerales bacterium]NNM25609.1 glyoxalase/bleomycin resistance/dioxygenase family protein [Phycisphaerales bacterium]
MTTESAVAFQTDTRIHIGLAVADRDRAVAFYRVLLGIAPTKVRAGYAKFEVADPPLNLSLNETTANGTPDRSGPLHYGIQVKTVDAVTRMTERLERAGLGPRIEEETLCCYAVQSKVWATDPDGNPWEVFVVLDDDAAADAGPDSACCPGEPANCCEAPAACCDTV